MGLKRTKTELINEFEGEVVSVDKIPDQINEGQEQYHIQVKPTEEKLVEKMKDTKTGKFHIYLGITKTSTEESVAEGSVLDKYCQEVEAVITEAKDQNTVTEVLNTMIDKKIKFVKKKLGKSFGGHEAKEHFVPQVVI